MSTIQALSRHLWCVLAYGKSSVDYRARLEGLQPVGKLIRNLSAQECRVQWELVCCAHLVKNIILSQLKLLCLSEELEHDIEYAFRECKALFKAAENFNRHVVVQLAYGRPTQPCHTSLWLKSSTVIKIVLDCRSQKVMDKLLQNPNAVTVIHTVRFETGFLRALMGSLATHTSTFHPQGGVPYVLEEAFSLAEAEMSWLDCLVPGAQSKALRRSTQWMEAQLWRLVAAQLVAAHQPLYMESFAAALEEATGREGEYICSGNWCSCRSPRCFGCLHSFFRVGMSFCCIHTCWQVPNYYYQDAENALPLGHRYSTRTMNF